MKKKIFLFMLMVLVVISLLIACKKDDEKANLAKENSKQESSENEADKKNEEYAQLVKETKGVSDLIEGDLVIQDVKIFKAEEENARLSLLVSYAELAYNYSDHVFENTSGMIMPLKLIYEKNADKYELKEKMNPVDGDGFFDSLLKMTDGDEELAREITNPSFNERYDNIMKELYEKAEEAGLKDFTLDIDKAPGYAKDESLFIEDLSNEPKNTIAIVNKEEYEKAKKNEAKVKWPHVNGLLYHKETKIAVKNIIDDFTK